MRPLALMLIAWFGLAPIAGCNVPIERFHGTDAETPPVDGAAPVVVDASPDVDALDSSGFAFEFDETRLPSESGWQFASDCPELGGIGLSESQAIAINGGNLHLDTTAPNTANVDAYYIRHDLIDLTRGWVIEARLRVISLESTPPPPALAFGMFVSHGGYFYMLWVGDAVQTSDTMTTPVNTAEFHVYRMYRTTENINYAVEIDGIVVLAGPPPSTAPLNWNRIVFGDGTCQAPNGMVEIDYIRFTQT